MKAAKGFTLMELIIVLALFSIIMCIAVPRMSLMKGFKESKELGELRTDIINARNLAILHGKIFDFTIYVDGNIYRIIYEGKVYKTVDLQYIKLLDKGTCRKFSFGPNGAALESGTIFVKDSRNTYGISTTPATSKISLKEMD